MDESFPLFLLGGLVPLAGLGLVGFLAARVERSSPWRTTIVPRYRAEQPPREGILTNLVSGKVGALPLRNAVMVVATPHGFYVGSIWTSKVFIPWERVQRVQRSTLPLFGEKWLEITVDDVSFQLEARAFVRTPLIR